MIRNILSKNRKRSYKSCEKLLEDCLTVKETENGKKAQYNILVSEGEKPVKELAEKYSDKLERFLDVDLDKKDREEVMNYMVDQSEPEDTLYFLSHKVNI